MKNLKVIILSLFSLAPLFVGGQVKPQVTDDQYQYCLKCLYQKGEQKSEEEGGQKQKFMTRADFVRVDRNIKGPKYVYKGEILAGLSLTYGMLNSDNASLYLALENLSASGSLLSVQPFLGYAYSDNKVVGARYGYTSLSGGLSSGELDLGELNGIALDIPSLNVTSEGNSYSIFHRTYAGLDNKGRFGLFADVELSYSQTTSTLSFELSETNKLYSKNISRIASIGFNPGMSVYVFPNVSTVFSFGFGGLNYTSIEQYDDKGNFVGKHQSSKLNFSFNLLAINFGIVVHFWQ